jgi:hypothetical protein
LTGCDQTNRRKIAITGMKSATAIFLIKYIKSS